MDKIARVRECVKRAGLPRLPPGDTDDLRSWGLDSLMAVSTLIEIQKDFDVRIPAGTVTESSFDSIERIAALIPD